MRMFGRILGAALLGLAAVTATAEDRPAGKDNALKLEGTYTIVAGEEGGQPVPAERIKGSVVRFTKDKITGTDKDKKEFFAATYTLDTSKMPARIKMKSTSPKEAETTGLIKKEGQTVVLIYALPGGEEPTDFKTKDKQQMFELKPLKGKGDKPKEKKTDK